MRPLQLLPPKPSSEAQLLEAKGGLQRMLAHIPLTDDERAAVEGDQSTVDRLVDQLADVATPAGLTQQELNPSKPPPSLPLRKPGSDQRPRQ